MRDLLNQWKAEVLRDARRRAERAREAYAPLKHKDNAYAIAILTIAEIHERALAVYEAACGPAVPPDPDRCACCGWPLKQAVEDGCVRGNCSMRPQPDRMYDPERFARELPLPLPTRSYLEAKAAAAGELLADGKIGRGECFKHEVDVAVQHDSGPIKLDDENA